MKLDLERSVADFIQTPPTWSEAAEIQLDRDVVSALVSGDQGRHEILRRWLDSYSVLMGYTSDRREGIRRSILEYADDSGRPKRLEGEHSILEQFSNLAGKLRIAAPPNADGSLRDVTSLCSKALWCCYPEDVPIFDRNARSALGVLARLQGIRPKEHGTEYGSFVSVWLQMYELLRPLFSDPHHVQTYGFQVRFFDRYLWYLGNPELRPN